MNGSVAQIVALTSYANVILQGNTEVHYNYDNSTAKYCQKIHFVDWIQTKKFMGIIKSKNHVEVNLADGFDSWIQFLKDNKVEHLCLHYFISGKMNIPDRQSSGFVGGGGRWLIEAKHGRHSDYWEARWSVTNQKASDKRIWTVTYGRVSSNYKVPTQKYYGLDIVYADLKNAITACKEFAKKHNIDFFYKCFVTASDCLTTDNFTSDSIYHKDIIPIDYYSSEAKRILFACQPAWVFGGMGSWNDLHFDGEEQNLYNRISDELYRTICNAICRSTNTIIKEN
jgi:hypothetical protein